MFYYIKVGCKGVFVIQTCFRNVHSKRNLTQTLMYEYCTLPFNGLLEQELVSGSIPRNIAIHWCSSKHRQIVMFEDIDIYV